MFAKNYINHNPQTVTNPSTCLLMTPSGQKSTFIYKLLRKMHCFLPFEIYRPYAVYSNASCLLCSLFHGQWILGGPPLLLGLVVFIYKQHESRALFALPHAGQHVSVSFLHHHLFIFFQTILSFWNANHKCGDQHYPISALALLTNFAIHPCVALPKLFSSRGCHGQRNMAINKENARPIAPLKGCSG